jgi:glucose/arabinose dehydrogenase
MISPEQSPGLIAPATDCLLEDSSLVFALLARFTGLCKKRLRSKSAPLSIGFRLMIAGIGLFAMQAAHGRTGNTNLKVPSSPPQTAVQVVDAFPGLVFTKPVVFASPRGDAKRLFIGELGGKIKVIPDAGATAPASSLLIDLATAITTPSRAPAESWNLGPNLECGLLGLDFHPNYAANGYFYVAYSVVKSNDPKVWYQRLSRFTIPSGQIGQPAPVADPGSELILFEQRDRGPNHNGGDVHFGNDGYLYMSIGDEDNPSDHYNNSQRIDMNFFGVVLRIDVDKKPENLEPNSHANPAASVQGFSAVNGIPRDEVPAGSGIFKARYSVPIDNPYVSVAQGGDWDGTLNGVTINAASLPYIRSEFWAIGLRSPWRFSIDAPTGEVWLADVGQSLGYPISSHAAEELNLIIRGGNYGWAYREGTQAGHKSAPLGFTSIAPLYQIVHNPAAPSAYNARCFIGGVVYRGGRFASLSGAYIFGDYIYGNIWALTRPGGVPTVQRIAGLASLTSFGVDPSNGDVLVSDDNSGSIRRIITTTPGSAFPNTLGATGLFTDLAALTPAPAVLPYSVNLAFWSDHAVKRRWFSIPDGTSRMTWSRDGAWSFPSGQLWVKHFELETERGNPASAKKRIETRLLVKNDNGVYGVSYRWNEAGTDAVLAADGGETFPVNITVGGAPYSQQWSIPSRAQCNACHSPQAGHALSFNTRQLNLENTIAGYTGNQIDFLDIHEYLSNSPESPNVLPRHLRPEETGFPSEARVRSYLAVNCGYCHAGANGTAPSAWDGRHEPSLNETGLIMGEATTSIAPYKLVVPGDTTHSVVLQRIAGSNGFSRMPPLATHEVDHASITLVTDWINQSLANRKSYNQWRLENFASTTSLEGVGNMDPDGDGVSNHSEFLGGTLPLNGASLLIPQMNLLSGQASLNFTIPANRSVQVEKSTDLSHWSLWDIPANNGLVQPGGASTISGSAESGSQFYRLKILER